MNSIKRLDEKTIHVIAAGEVIETPTAVVKELVDNSLDSLATHIKVTCRQGGKTLIEVRDNGQGMTKDDISIAPCMHTTSKLVDVHNITTLGFRGEALASMNAVSRLRIASRTAKQEHGWRWEQGTIRPCSMNPGTYVSVCDVFFSTPARFKFLASTSTENARIQRLLKEYALGHPLCHFSLKLDDSDALSWTQATDFAQRFCDIYPDTKAHTKDVDISMNGMSISGIITEPSMHHGHNRFMHIFVNGRPIVDRNLLFFIRGCYGDTLPQQRWPCVALHMTIPPKQVDVNVHPTKREVRFQFPIRVQHMLKQALQQSLGVHKGHEEKLSFYGTQPLRFERMGSAHQQETRFFPQRSPTDSVQTPQFKDETMLKSPESGVFFDDLTSAQTTLADLKKKTHSAVEPHPLYDDQSGMQSVEFSHKFCTQHPSWKNLEVVGQIFLRYIVCLGEHGLILVDQHAAHERLVYEHLKTCPQHYMHHAQTLLHPYSITMEEEYLSHIEKFSQELHDKNFIYTLNNNTMIFTQIPRMMVLDDVESWLLSVLHHASVTEAWTTYVDRFLGHRGCRTSIWSGKPLHKKEMTDLIEAMSECPNGDFCNHGRPTWILLQKQTCDHMFLRS